ncbi:MAG: hypothetical protein JWP37_1353 [Mucilaginibacter sp.]|nr:hypothetical protein [Mucilaginibacter sp.]
MTLKEAKEKCLYFGHLAGTAYENYEISELVIVPDNLKVSSEVILRVAHHIPYDELLTRYNHFNVVALLNAHDYPFNGNMVWKYLDDIIK